MEIAQQLLAIALVLGALCAAVWALKRKGWASVRVGASRNGQKRLEAIDRLVLTPHHSVHLIRVADRTLLVGLSPNGCNLLETSPASSLAPRELDHPC
jgi:flagellar biosynthetic protein FliO